MSTDSVPDAPLTREEALLLAKRGSRNPDSVRPYAHEGLESARFGRGYAFSHVVPRERGDTAAYAIVTVDGLRSSGLLLHGRTVEQAIAEHLRRHAHANRPIPDAQIGPSQRLALAAFAAGAGSVAAFPHAAGVDAATVDHAEYVLLFVTRHVEPGGDGRRALAREDHLLEEPEARRRYTHPCPLCGGPAFHAERYPRSVCGDCFERTADASGRPVRGSNVSLSGGMIAHYTDTPEGVREECVEVTRTGRCFIGGRPAYIREGHFGGIVVEADW